jgi:hypothetical protein
LERSGYLALRSTDVRDSFEKEGAPCQRVRATARSPLRIVRRISPTSSPFPAWGGEPAAQRGLGVVGQGFLPNRRSRSELLTTVTDESAIAAAAKIGALSRRKGIAGEAMATGISTLL